MAAPQIEASKIDDELLRTIYDCDQALYPAPLTFARLQSWRDAYPKLSILCQTPAPASVDVGAIMVMPLQKKHWVDLLMGKLKETDVEASMFAVDDADEGVDVGLHVFHVERFGKNQTPRGLTRLAMRLVQDIASSSSWNIVGYSVFQKLGFEPTGYREAFVKTSDGQHNMICIGPHEEVSDANVMVVRHGNDGF